MGNNKKRGMRRILGMPNIKGEGAPIHPDDIEAPMSGEKYDKQMKAYNEYYGFKVEK